MSGIGLKLINLGSSADSGDGSSAREGGRRVNENFIDMYSQFGDVEIIEESTDANYGCRKQASNIDEFSAQLHPSGYWQQVRARSPGVTRSDGTDANVFFMSRGEQVAFDFSAMGENEPYRIILPLANKGDVVKIRDLNNTLANGNRVILSSRPYEYSNADMSTWNWGKLTKNIQGALPSANHVNIGGVSRSHKPVNDGRNTSVPETPAQDELFFTTRGLNIEVVYGGDEVGWTVYKLDPFSAAEDLKGRELFERPCFSASKAINTNGTRTEDTTILFNPKLTSTFQRVEPADQSGSEYWEGSNEASNTVYFDDQWWSDGNGNSVILKNASGSTHSPTDWQIFLPYPQDITEEEDFTSRTVTIVNDTGRPFIVRPMWRTRDGIPMKGSDFVTRTNFSGVGAVDKYKFIEGVDSIETDSVTNLFVQFDASIRKVKYVYASHSDFENGKANGWILTETERTERFTSHEREFYVVNTDEGFDDVMPSRNETEFPVTRLNIPDHGNSAKTGIINIITGTNATQDPYFDTDNATIQAIDLKVIVNGVEWVQGEINNGDFYPFYGENVSLTSIQPNDYATTPSNNKRYSLFNGIHFNVPLLKGDFVTVRWKTLEETDTLETAAIRDIVESLVPNFIPENDNLTITSVSSANGSNLGNILQRATAIATAGASGNLLQDISIWDAGDYDGTSLGSSHGLQHKRNNIPNIVPDDSEMLYSELAVNIPDGVLYTKNLDNQVLKVGVKARGDDTKDGSLSLIAGTYVVQSVPSGTNTAFSAPAVSLSLFDTVSMNTLRPRTGSEVEVDARLRTTDKIIVEGGISVSGGVIESSTLDPLVIGSNVELNGSLILQGNISKSNGVINFTTEVSMDKAQVNTLASNTNDFIEVESKFQVANEFQANGSILNTLGDNVLIDDDMRLTGSEVLLENSAVGVYFNSANSATAKRAITTKDLSGDFNIRTGHLGTLTQTDGIYLTDNDGATIFTMNSDVADGEIIIGVAPAGVAGNEFNWGSKIVINPTTTTIESDVVISDGNSLQVSTLKANNSEILVENDLALTTGRVLKTNHIESDIAMTITAPTVTVLGTLVSSGAGSGQVDVPVTYSSDLVVPAPYKISAVEIDSGNPTTDIEIGNTIIVDGDIVATGQLSNSLLTASGGIVRYGTPAEGFSTWYEKSGVSETFTMEFGGGLSGGVIVHESGDFRALTAIKGGDVTLYHDNEPRLVTDDDGAMAVNGNVIGMSETRSITEGSLIGYGGYLHLGGFGNRTGGGIEVSDDGNMSIGVSNNDGAIGFLGSGTGIRIRRDHGVLIRALGGTGARDMLWARTTGVEIYAGLVVGFANFDTNNGVLEIKRHGVINDVGNLNRLYIEGASEASKEYGSTIVLNNKDSSDRMGGSGMIFVDVNEDLVISSFQKYTAVGDPAEDAGDIIFKHGVTVGENFRILNDRNMMKRPLKFQYHEDDLQQTGGEASGIYFHDNDTYMWNFRRGVAANNPNIWIRHGTSLDSANRNEDMILLQRSIATEHDDEDSNRKSMVTEIGDYIMCSVEQRNADPITSELRNQNGLCNFPNDNRYSIQITPIGPAGSTVSYDNKTNSGFDVILGNGATGYNLTLMAVRV